MHAEARWATGGQPAIDGGTDAPYFTCLTLAGRPSDQHEHLLEGMTALIVKHLKVDRLVVRGRIIPVDPAHWAIGGSVASTARKAEIDGRRSVGAPGPCDRDRSDIMNLKTLPPGSVGRRTEDEGPSWRGSVGEYGKEKV